MAAERSAAYSAEDQWRGLYAGRPEDQKMVNAKALAKLIEERNTLAAWKAARIESHPTDAEFYGR